jgi:hypothetical protein
MTTRLQDPGNFLLCCDHVRDMVKDSVGEDKIKTVVRERQRQSVPHIQASDKAIREGVAWWKRG